MQWWCTAQTTPWSWEWRPYPGVWLFVAALALGYLALRRRAGARVESGGLPFAVGCLMLWIALDWPVGALGAGYLASVHMVQFLLIALVAPPFLLMGVRPLLRPEAPAWNRGWVRLLTHPVVTLSLFTVIMGLTHWPLVVDGLMSSQWGSFVLDLLWLSGGALFWWPVIQELPRRSWMGDPVRMGYLIAGTLVNTGVFIYLTFSELPVYATYELAPPVSGLSTREDQRLAGLLMKMGGAVILWTTITLIFFRWALSETGDDPDLHASAT